MPRPFGFLNIDKPAGKSSRFVVDRVVKLVRPAKAGHAGTLDPLATGVLLVCVGQATRLIDFVHAFDKRYLATFRLGCTSETDDLEGEVVENPSARPVSQSEIEALLPRFSGEIDQVPPRYSAVHVGGQRAYHHARKGRDIELSPRRVRVESIRIVEFAWPDLKMDIVCGSGTYIRSIGRDLGEMLDTGGIMTALCRTAIGPWQLADAAPLADVSRESWQSLLQPPLLALPQFAQYVATEDEIIELRHGRYVGARVDQFAAPESIAVLTPAGELACLARFDSTSGQLQPNMVFPAD